jgi:GNAT superfamily N-acetyltransferase
VHDLQITLLDRWDPALAAEFSRFYSEKTGDTPWQGRWDFSEAQFHWKFAAPPVGPSALAIARQGQTVMGACSVNFRNLAGLGAKLRVGELADLAVAPALRGQGVFPALVKRITDHVLEQGADGVYCVPNSQGARALARTGLYESAAAAVHATWLAPLRPMALLSSRYRQFARLTAGDVLWKTLLRAVPAPPSYRRNIEEFVARFQPLEAAELLRLPQDRQYLQYRAAEYPVPQTYRALQLRANPSCGVIVRDVLFKQHRALIGARTMFQDRRGFRSAIAMLRAEALATGCAFAALWAPRRRAYAIPLLLAGYLPVQRKEIMVANDSSDAFTTRLAALHLDMLDSDKI